MGHTHKAVQVNTLLVLTQELHLNPEVVIEATYKQGMVQNMPWELNQKA